MIRERRKRFKILQYAYVNQIWLHVIWMKASSVLKDYVFRVLRLCLCLLECLINLLNKIYRLRTYPIYWFFVGTSCLPLNPRAILVKMADAFWDVGIFALHTILPSRAEPWRMLVEASYFVRHAFNIQTLSFFSHTSEEYLIFVKKCFPDVLLSKWRWGNPMAFITYSVIAYSFPKWR